MRFAVWAPVPGRVELVLRGERLAMERGEDGWWTADADAVPDDRYGYSLDGGPVRPDPRSRHQPDGIDAPSAVYDDDAFDWHDHEWTGIRLPGAVLYELHIGTFTPAWTFAGAIERLPHLAALGIDAVELLPVANASGSRGWGYDGVDLFAPHPAYGGPDGLKRFVDACHGHGIGVIMDVVYNHLGPAGNHLAELGPYFTDRHVTHWGDAVNFDGPGADEVRRFVIDNACMWLRDHHCDGLRLDAVHAIVDDSPVHVLAELSAAVQDLAGDLGRSLVLIAESDLNDPVFVRRRPDGYGLHASWADDWHHALHAALTGERDGYYEDFGSLDHLAKALRQAWVYDGAWSPHRKRPHGCSPEGLTGDRFVVSAQNHDQIGNRAAGDRLTSLTSPGRVRVAAALVLTSPFVPMLFQGEEWGTTTPFQYFTDHQDPALGQAVSDGRRREFAVFGWSPEAVPDPQDPATFERSKLDWSEVQKAGHAEILDLYRKLIKLRRATPDLTDPWLHQVEVWHGDQHVVIRRGPCVVAANLAGTPQTVSVRALPRAVLLATSPGVIVERDRLVLPPESAAVVSVR